jgi:hypothetical protein
LLSWAEIQYINLPRVRGQPLQPRNPTGKNSLVATFPAP